jgi:dihydrofolate reductase
VSVRVFVATSLDGFVAGPGDDLSWLPTDVDLGEHGFAPFFAWVGAVLMGRRTFDVVAAMDVPWPYGDRPVLVATHRPLPPLRDGMERVRVVDGPIEALVDQALRAAGGRDVYLDGAQLIRAAMEAGVVLRLTLTVVPIRLGGGVPLFGVGASRALRLRGVQPLPEGLVQLDYETIGGAERTAPLTSLRRASSSPR